MFFFTPLYVFAKIDACFNLGQKTVDAVEMLKPEYDSLQGEVVNFINTEVSTNPPSLPQLRETLHSVQECWGDVWLIVHVFLEK